jgi:hypothetical protein
MAAVIARVPERQAGIVERTRRCATYHGATERVSEE